ncbi:MAG: PAS domain S-box protein [Verrucomicrobia bacterium]|nr:PAS domain S-box protein [Verrucomicrobiota bacterium]
MSTEREHLEREHSSTHPGQSELSRLVLELAPEALLVAKGPQWRLVSANRAAGELFLFGPDAMREAAPALADLFADGQAGVVKLVQQAEGRETPVTIEAVLRDRFGLTFPAAVSARAVVIDGEPHLLLGLRDITELKRAEVRRRFFYAMAESAIDAIVAWSEGDAIVYANPSSHRLFGFEPDGLLGRPLRDLFEDAEAADTFIRESAALGNWHVELRLRRADGTVFEALLSTWRQPEGARGVDAEGLSVTVCFLRDITEQKTAERDLRRSEERFRMLADLLPETVFEHDLEGRFTFVNKRALETFGYCAEDVRGGKMALDMLVPEDRERARQHLERRLRGEELGGIEYMALAKDGHRVPILLYASPILRGDTPAGLRGIAIDISNRKAAEEAVRASEERFRALFESAPDAIFLMDPQGIFIDGNRAAEQLIGTTRETLIGHSLTSAQVLPEEQLADATARLDEVRSGQAGGPYEYSLIRRTGQRVPVQIRVLPITISGQTLILGIARDVTETKRLQAQLERYSHGLEELVAERTHEVHLLSRIITSTVTAWVITDPAGRLVRWNHAFGELSGYRLEELIHMSWSDLIPPGQHETEQALVRVALAGSGHQIVEQDLVRGDGFVVPIESRFDALDVGESEHVVFRIVTDISLRRETERRLIEARHEAEESSRLKSEFLASISHELRTPLNGILGLANTLTRLRKQGQDDRTDDFLGRIIRSSRHLQNLITEVLDLSRIEAGRMTLDLEPVDAVEVIQSIEGQFYASFEERDLAFSSSVADTTPPVLADRTRLIQILVNLVSNAVKFTDPGGSIGIQVKPAAGGRAVEFSVSDTGRGIPADKLEQVFERFEQLDRSGAKLGVGLGLAICRQIVEAQGGRIWAESELGVGSRFVFTLPPAVGGSERPSEAGEESPQS